MIVEFQEVTIEVKELTQKTITINIDDIDFVIAYNKETGKLRVGSLIEPIDLFNSEDHDSKVI